MEALYFLVQVGVGILPILILAAQIPTGSYSQLHLRKYGMK